MICMSLKPCDDKYFIKLSAGSPTERQTSTCPGYVQVRIHMVFNKRSIFRFSIPQVHKPKYTDEMRDESDRLKDSSKLPKSFLKLQMSFLPRHAIVHFSPEGWKSWRCKKRSLTSNKASLYVRETANRATAGKTWRGFVAGLKKDNFRFTGKTKKNRRRNPADESVGPLTHSLPVWLVSALVRWIVHGWPTVPELLIEAHHLLLFCQI